MDRTSLYTQRLTMRGNFIGRTIRIVNRDEGVGVVYVNHIDDSPPSESSSARTYMRQRAQPTQTNARTGHCVRALVCRTRSKSARITSLASGPLRVRSA